MYDMFIQLSIAMAVAALIGDATIHILPEVFGHEEHEHHHHHSEEAQDVSNNSSHAEEHHEGHEHSAEGIFKALSLIAGALVMYMMEIMFTYMSSMGVPHCHGGSHHHGHHDSSSLNNTDSQDNHPHCENEVAVKKAEKCLRSHQLHVGTPVSCQNEEAMNLDDHCHGVCSEPEGDRTLNEEEIMENDLTMTSNTDPLIVIKPTQNLINTCTGLKKISNLAMLVIAGDSLHNFIDGFNIGVSFQGPLREGITTSLAVILHEIPHEIGDIAILMNSGMTFWRAIILHFASGIFCYLGSIFGCFMGFVGDKHLNRLKCATAGMFYYIALVGLVPGMLKDISQSKNKGKLILVHLAGFIIGISTMIALALMELYKLV